VEAPAISVVIPARDAAVTLPRTLAALERQDLDRPFETIVVDNGSVDGTGELAEAAGLPVRVLTMSEKCGAGAARNAGAAVASGGLLAFTDADCFPAPSWLREALAGLEHADLVQGRVEADPAAAPGPFDHTVWVTGPSALFETANLAIRRRAFERLGGFADWQDAGGGRPFGEDTWLGWRARRAGMTTGFADRALVHHAVLPRTAGAYIGERLRLRWFPALVRRIPELRREFLRARLFLTPRTAMFDLAVTGAVAATIVGAWLPLAAALPYALSLGRRLVAHGPWAPFVGVVEVAADAVGFAALLAGSVRTRTPVL
jgi:glycosyltransferase involved in cell wall biosynthesis